MCLFWIKIYSKTPLKYYSIDSKGGICICYTVFKSNCLTNLIIITNKICSTISYYICKSICKSICFVSYVFLLQFLYLCTSYDLTFFLQLK